MMETNSQLVRVSASCLESDWYVPHLKRLRPLFFPELNFSVYLVVLKRSVVSAGLNAEQCILSCIFLCGKAMVNAHLCTF